LTTSFSKGFVLGILNKNLARSIGYSYNNAEYYSTTGSLSASLTILRI